MYYLAVKRLAALWFAGAFPIPGLASAQSPRDAHQANGQIDIDGAMYAGPGAAAAVIAGRPTHGRSFFLVDQASRRSLRDVWRDYVDSLSDDVDEESDDEGDDDEA